MSRSLKRKLAYEPPVAVPAEPVEPFVADDGHALEAVESPALALREHLRVALEDPSLSRFSARGARNDLDWSPRTKLLFVVGASSTMWLLIIAAGYVLVHSHLFG